MRDGETATADPNGEDHRAAVAAPVHCRVRPNRDSYACLATLVGRLGARGAPALVGGIGKRLAVKNDAHAPFAVASLGLLHGDREVYR